MIQTFLQLTKSIKVELVPGNELYLDKKGFTWRLVKYSESNMGIQIYFENPEYISFGKVDTLKITFSNSAKFLRP